MNIIFSTLDNPIMNSILIFLTISILLYAIKPRIMFKKNGEMKSFGYGKNKTCFTFGVTVFTATLIGYILLRVMKSSSKSFRSSRSSSRLSSRPSRYSFSRRYD